MNGYYSQVIQELKAAGYAFKRGAKGSHELWSNGVFTTTVPFNCKSRMTANGIMKACGISKRF